MPSSNENDSDDQGRDPIVMKIKNTNLVALEASVLDTFMQESNPLSDDVISSALEYARQECGNCDRQDMLHRLDLYKQLLQKLRRDEALSEDDYRIPCGAGNEVVSASDLFMMIMANVRPACVGNRKTDVRHMDLGLKGDGSTICSICRDALSNDDEKIVTLPCCHSFHDACVVQYLDSDLAQQNWNCPYCRQPVPFVMDTYRVQYQAQLRSRFAEYLLSGFCPECIIWVMERVRNEPIQAGEYQDGGAVRMGDVGKSGSVTLNSTRL